MSILYIIFQVVFEILRDQMIQQETHFYIYPIRQLISTLLGRKTGLDAVKQEPKAV